jgi:long-subunit fatty acid transport protein
LMKSFRQASIVAAYTRSEASSVFVSSGYYDQADIGYNQRIGQKITVNAGVGEFRTSNTGTTNNEYGKRAGAGIAYQWFPRLSVNVGYNLAHQNGTQTSQFSPVGDTSYFSVGLTWLLGAHSGL